MGRGAATGYGGDAFEKLENDHRLILETLRKMEQTDESSTAKRTGLFLLAKRKLEHALAEEDVVYPLLTDEAERREAAKHLYDEHADMKILLFEIETALMRGEPWATPVRSLREMVERHARKEEQEQFPRLRQVLGEKKFAQVGAQVHREEALIL